MGALFRLKRSQVKAAAKMLARAFENDPLHIAYFPDTTKRVQQIYHLMFHSIRYCMRYGEVYTTSSKLEGIALWQLVDPIVEQDQEDKPTSLFANWLLFRLRVALGKALEKVFSLYDYMLSKQYEIVPSRHWYFIVLGVDPKFHGQGFGSRLITPMLARVDKEQLPCYLDTNNEKNIRLYEYFGFKVVKKYQIPGSEVINWSMLRKSRN